MGRMKCQGLNRGPAYAGRWQLPGGQTSPIPAQTEPRLQKYLNNGQAVFGFSLSTIVVCQSS